MSDQRIYMLNALWFNPEGGRETYMKYIEGASPIVARFGGRKVDAFVPEKALIGAFDPDLLFFVEWPSPEVFQQFVADPEYAKVQPLREAALKDSLLILCRRPELPF